MKKIYTIGRDLQNDIVIEDDSDVISRLHATIRFDGSKMFIIDQSQNGTYVNGMRMASNEEVPVTRKDTISFANVANLDWNRLPEPGKTKMKIFWIALSSILVLLLIGWGALNITRSNQQSNSEKPNTGTSTNYVPNSGEEVVADNDTISGTPDSVEEVRDEPMNSDKRSKKNTEKDNTDKDSKSDKDKEEPDTEGDIPLY